MLKTLEFLILIGSNDTLVTALNWYQRKVAKKNNDVILNQPQFTLLFLIREWGSYAVPLHLCVNVGKLCYHLQQNY